MPRVHCPKREAGLSPAVERISYDLQVQPVFRISLIPRNNERCVIKSQEMADVFYRKIEPLIVESDIDGIRPYGFGTEGIWKPVTCNEWYGMTEGPFLVHCVGSSSPSIK